MYCSLLGSSVHGIFQARALEWGAIAFSIELSLNKVNYFSHLWQYFSYLNIATFLRFEYPLLLPPFYGFFFNFEYFKHTYMKVQVYPGDTVGLIPDTTIEWIMQQSRSWIFQFPNTYESYVYTVLQSIKYTTTLCFTKTMYIPQLKIPNAKNINHHVNLQVITFSTVTSKITDHRSL